MKQIGEKPLVAFYVGLVLLIISIVWAEMAHYEDWEDLARGIALLIISGVAFLYAIGFGAAAFVQYVRYRKDPSVSVRYAKIALLLHTCTAIGLPVWWILFP